MNFFFFVALHLIVTVVIYQYLTIFNTIQVFSPLKGKGILNLKTKNKKTNPTFCCTLLQSLGNSLFRLGTESI